MTPPQIHTFIQTTSSSKTGKKSFRPLSQIDLFPFCYRMRHIVIHSGHQTTIFLWTSNRNLGCCRMPLQIDEKYIHHRFQYAMRQPFLPKRHIYQYFILHFIFISLNLWPPQKKMCDSVHDSSDLLIDMFVRMFSNFAPFAKQRTSYWHKFMCSIPFSLGLFSILINGNIYGRA